MKSKIAVLLTCYNRKDQTINCINTLVRENKDIDFRFVVTDDNSTDGTKDELKRLPYRIKILEGDGKLFWNGGMRRAIAFAMKSAEKFEYALLVNDDVSFYPGSISKMLDKLNRTGADVIVGATCDSYGEMTYGGVERTSKHFAKFKPMLPTQSDDQCDTFNCNAVLIKADVFRAAGNFDDKYTHSMGDYDYGIMLRNKGFDVISSSEYVGVCEDNDIGGNWRDKSLSRKERLKLKEGPKGLPRKDWFHFVRKNYGLFPALYHSLTPYLRILIKK